jgi:uncharacterized membrane protein
MNKRIQKLVMTALFTAICCVVTMIIQIPSPLKGYVNIGDSVVLLAGWLLQPQYGILAAGLGSALADIFSGYILYAPVTFVIKGLMALNAYYCFKGFNKVLNKSMSRIISGIISELIMIVGYLIFDGILYGFMAAFATISSSFIQGFAGLILGITLVNVCEKSFMIRMRNV